MKSLLNIIIITIGLLATSAFINAEIPQPNKSYEFEDTEQETDEENPEDEDVNEDNESDKEGDDDNTDLVKKFQKYIDLGLPLLVITTDEGRDPTYDVASPPEGGAVGNGTINAEKLPGTICRIEPDGVISYNSGDYVKGKSGCTLKVRGNGSARRPKKTFKIKLQKKEDLMMRGDEKYKDKNWVLIIDGNMHSHFGFYVNSLFDNGWTPSSEFVNVIINDDFRGMYLLVEGIERNEKCRIPASKEGFVIENDCYWWTENGEYINSMDHPVADYTFKYPDYEDLTDEDLNWIQNRVDAFEESILTGNYEDYIDLRSFASWVLCHDLLGTDDMLGANRFMFLRDREEGTKFEMGPVWDLDTSQKRAEAFGKIHSTPHLIVSKLLSGDNRVMKDTYEYLWLTSGDLIYDAIIDRLEDMLETGNKAYDDSADANNLIWEPRGSAPIAKWVISIANKLEYYAKRKAWLDANISPHHGTISVDEIIDDSYNDDSLVFSINGIFLGTFKDFQNSKNHEKGIYVVRGKNRSRKIVI